MVSVSPGEEAVAIIVATFNILAFVVLSSMLLTFFFSNSVKRHPIFINFIICSILESAFTIFRDTANGAALATGGNGLGVNGDVLYYMGFTMFVVSFLALIIHLGLLLKEALSGVTYQKERILVTLLLIVLSYIAAVPSLAILRRPNIENIIGYVLIAISYVTTILDAAVLIVFFRNKGMLRLSGLDTKQFGRVCFRLLALSIVRVGITTFSLSKDIIVSEKSTTTHSFSVLYNVEYVLERIHGLLVVIFFLQKDIIRLWLSVLKRTEVATIPNSPRRVYSQIRVEEGILPSPDFRYKSTVSKAESPAPQLQREVLDGS